MEKCKQYFKTIQTRSNQGGFRSTKLTDTDYDFPYYVATKLIIIQYVYSNFWAFLNPF